MKKLYTFIALVALAGVLYAQPHKSIMQIELAKYDSLEKAGIDIYKKARPAAKTNVYDNCTLNKKVFGWFPYWQGTTYQNFEWSLISDLSYFAYEVDPNTGDPVSTHSFETAAVVDEALAHGVNVSLCVTLFSNHSTFLGSSTARQNLIDNLIQLVSSRGANGVNIDFEGVSSSLKTEFNDFLVQLADAFHTQLPGSQVSVALYAVDWGDVFDEALLNNHLDLFIIMGYDYYYSGSSTAGPTDPLYAFVNGSILNLSKSVNYYLNEGISREKLLIGLPYYGFDYPTDSPDLYASTTGSGSAKIFTTVMDNAYGYYSSSNNHFDYNSYSNYYVYNNGNWHQCFINNRQTMEKRLSLINEYDLGGMGIWALGYDDGYMDYWDAIANRFSDCSTLCNDTIFDNGGPTRDYYDATDYTFTISPQNAQGIRITFESLDLESGYDSLWIYDGPDETHPLLAALSGNTIPQPLITSSNSATVKFHSDGATVGAGWKFYWECITDNILPVTTITSPAWVSSDFNAYFSDWDNTGVKDKFTLYAVRDSNGVWHAPADSGMFCDDFEYNSLTENPAWTSVEGTWDINQGKIRQSDESLSNTNIYFPVKQTLGGKILITWKMKIGGTGTNRRAGLHFFIDHPDSSNRDNNYMVYFRVDQDAVQIYKYINNSYNLMTNDECTVNADTWYNYKVLYDPQTGNIKVYQNDIPVSQWTDTTPLQTGDYISLRTGNATAEYDDIRVYYERNYTVKQFTVDENSPVAMVPFENSTPDKPALLISSVITDSTGNFSSLTDKYVNVDFSAPSMLPPVNDGTAGDIDTLYDNNMIAANWNAAYDYNDSIESYFVAVGSQPFASDIIAWHNAGSGTLFDSSGISLDFDSTYFTSVYCKNKAGLTSDTICSDGVTIINPSQPPHADFYSSDTTICAGDTVYFYSVSEYAAGYLWIFEGGSPYYSIEANPRVTYSNPGYYDVTLIVTNQIGSDTLVVNNMIYVEGKPIAQFTASPTEGMQPLEVSFSNSSVNSYYYHWDFGDGTTSSEINPVHIYNVVASYDVTLIAGNNSCPADTLTRQDYITVYTDVDETAHKTGTTVYPVPAHNSITVQSDSPGINKLVIIDSNGKAVIEINNFHNRKTIDITKLANGFYYVVLFDKNNLQAGTVKIVKK